MWKNILCFGLGLYKRDYISYEYIPYKTPLWGDHLHVRTHNEIQEENDVRTGDLSFLRRTTIDQASFPWQPLIILTEDDQL